MKIKIKSREEIERTLNKSGYHVDGSCAYFSYRMFSHCNQTLESEKFELFGYKLRTESELSVSGGWNWHPDWYEVLEPDFTDEDLMDIELMDEMLEYFLSI